MDMKIAVFIDSDGKTITLNESGTAVVYLKQDNGWKVIEEIEYKTDESMSSNEIRNNIKSLAESLGDAKIFVAGEVKGIAYTIFDGMGFNIWKVKGKPENFLDAVLKNEEEAKLDKEKPEVIPVPIKNGIDGNYFIDLKTEMQNSSFSSKQILLPFLRNTKFKELEIICGHVPPWFDGEFKSLNLESRTEKMRETTYKVYVYAKDIK